VARYYVAKLDTWFDKGTGATLVDDYRLVGLNTGLFRGIRDGQIDEEVCQFDEFDEVEVGTWLWNPESGEWLDLR
jgi:hypothetical protein